MKSLLAGTAIGLLTAFLAGEDPTGSPDWKNPEIRQWGEIVVLSKADVQPKDGSKAVVDCTTQESADGIAKGLTKAARWINLNAAAGVRPDQIRVVAVLHGDATKAALTDEAYSRVTDAEANPNRELIARLRKAGVDVYVCGQAMAHRKYPVSGVLPEVKVATAALTVLVETQRDGYAFLPD